MIKQGDRFGRWTVVSGPKRKGYESLYTCKCDCGTIKDVYGRALTAGKSKSCGCLQKEPLVDKHKELEGLRIGRWKVLKYLKTEKKKSLYLCRCDCGTKKVRSKRSILNDNSLSCGCLRSELRKESSKDTLDKGRKILETRYRKGGTNLANLTEKVSKNSSTGVKGVSYIRKTKKYRAYITLRRKQYYLGIYDTLEEAKEARKEAEKKLFEPILKEHGRQ